MNAVYKRTDEFDGKILELAQQGLSTLRIAQQLPNYTMHHVSYRLQKLRGEIQPGHASSRTRWSDHEDTVLKEKREAGFSTRQIVPFLPGRSVKAISLRYCTIKRRDVGAVPPTNSNKPWSPEEKQRAIDMLTVDGLSLEVVSERLGRTKVAVQRTWDKYCSNTLRGERTTRLRRKDEWLPEHDNILIEQRSRGVSFRDIALKLPGRTMTALYIRAQILQIADPKLSKAKGDAVRKDLQAVIDGNATFDEVAGKLSSTISRKHLTNTLLGMRQGLYKTQSSTPTDTTATTKDRIN